MATIGGYVFFRSSAMNHPWPATGSLPTEQVGSIPRPTNLQQAVLRADSGIVTAEELRGMQDVAVAETLERLRETGSQIVSDGEQRRTSFAVYPLGDIPSASHVSDAEVFAVFADGHHRVLPKLTMFPFRFQSWAADDVAAARPMTDLDLKQAVISPSMLSLMIPDELNGDYSREDFIYDIVDGCAEDIRRCFAAGAQRVSIDFTEGRLALRNDLRSPWAGAGALGGFIELMNRVLDKCDAEQRMAIGVHTCPGNANDSPHSADVDYAGLIPELFQIEAGYFLMQAASEQDPDRVARLAGEQLKRRADSSGITPKVLLGVTNPTNPKLETAHEVRDQLLRAARFIPAEYLGSTDDCGFSPYLVDEKPKHGSPDFARDVAFAKIAARVQGTQLASEELSGAAQ